MLTYPFPMRDTNLQFTKRTLPWLFDLAVLTQLAFCCSSLLSIDTSTVTNIKVVLTVYLVVTISIKIETHERLSNLGKHGETFDQIINRCIDAVYMVDETIKLRVEKGKRQHG
jgi:hypothetical protein